MPSAWHRILRRHFISMAKAANYSEHQAEKVLDEMLDQLDDVIANVTKRLPSTFPTTISNSVFEGMKMRHGILMR